MLTWGSCSGSSRPWRQSCGRCTRGTSSHLHSQRSPVRQWHSHIWSPEIEMHALSSESNLGNQLVYMYIDDQIHARMWHAKCAAASPGFMAGASRLGPSLKLSLCP